MKKFLSLVLALVMTMSLVTISAGATEYKDLTDKDEIQYEEAVAVLNRLGIITGYSDGSFQPKKELTRGAAAKIIVSLLIGTDAASNLVASTAPYTDVPVNHTFAGVISYCKTSKIIDGYTDGSFRPEGTLSGYAFTKMLLGALGYKSEYEAGGFTGAGWTMNVARLGGEAGLFDRLSFKGNETVNREQACQLALNTLKATLVEYTGGLTITSGEASVVGAASRSYKTSNQDFARHIYEKQQNVNQSGWYTVEFGEEHFVDLRLEHDNSMNKTTTPNDLGKPSAEWSYKKVTIGTYPLEADFTYTEQMAHEESDSDAAKVRKLGLDGYTLDPDNDGVVETRVWINGDENIGSISKVADIADLTDNGVTVEVYVDDQTADFITDVVVIQTQLMEVRRIGADYVSLQKYDDNKGLEDKNDDIVGYNQNPLDTDIENVEVNDDYFEFLHGLKAGDVVAVVPAAIDHDGANEGWKVWEAYTPESVSGKLSKVTTYGKTTDGRNAVSVTVGGTEYKIALWNKDLKDIRAEDIQVTVNDVTLLLDKAGNAMLAKDVGDTSEYMVLKGFYSTTVNNRIVTVAEGWDMSGNELNLNLGVNGRTQGAQPGDLVQYTNVGTSSTADWAINVGHGDGNDSPYIYDVNWKYNQGTYEIKASNTRIALEGATVTKKGVEVYGGHEGDAIAANTIASGVKFIYVNFNQEGDEVESIEILKGMQNVSNDELKTAQGGRTAEAYTTDKGAVKAVVIKDVSSNVISNRVAYIRDWDGEETYDNGKRLYRYTVAMTSPEGYEDETKIWTDEKLNIGDFASYTAGTREGFEPFYSMHRVNMVPGKVTTALHDVLVHEVVDVNSGLIRIDCTGKTVTDANIYSQQGSQLGIGDMSGIVRLDGANWLYQGDRTDGNGKRVDIRSAKELDNYLKDHPGKTVSLSFVFNDNVTNDGFRSASLVIVEEIDLNGSGTSGGTDVVVDRYSGVAKPTVGNTPGLVDTLDGNGYILGSLNELLYVPASTNVSFKISQKAYSATSAGYTTIDIATDVPAVTTALTGLSMTKTAGTGVAGVARVEAVKDTTVTAANWAAKVAAGLWTTTDAADEDAYTQVSQDTRDEVVYGENAEAGITNQATLNTAIGNLGANEKLYVRTGAAGAYTYTEVTGEYTPAVYTEVYANTVNTQPADWADKLAAGLYTESGGVYTEVDKTSGTWAQGTAYYSMTPEDGDPADAYQAGNVYVKGTVTAVPVAQFDSTAVYYSTPLTEAKDAVPAEWTVSFAMPAYNFTITGMTPKA